VENAPRKNTKAFGCTDIDPLLRIGTSFRRKRNALGAKISKERKNHWKNVPTAAEEPLNCSFMEQLILESIARAVVLAVIVFANFLQVENAPRKNTAAFGCTNSDPLMKRSAIQAHVDPMQAATIWEMETQVADVQSE